MLSNEFAIPRLVPVRHLYNLGLQQAVSSFPAASVLCFHNSIEMFLQIGIEHHRAKTGNKDDFLALFRALKEKVPDLESENALMKLNQVRVMVKHKAVEPSNAEVERCQTRSKEFFEKNCPKVFCVDFFSFSMTSAISQEEIRNELQAAERALGEGNFLDSLTAAAKAFARMRISHKFFSPSRVLSGSSKSGEDVKAARREREDREKLKFTLIGIPYADYQKFTQLAPRVFTSASGRQVVAVQRCNNTAEEARFCIAFVVDVVLAAEKYERQLAR